MCILKLWQPCKVCVQISVLGWQAGAGLSHSYHCDLCDCVTCWQRGMLLHSLPQHTEHYCVTVLSAQTATTGPARLLGLLGHQVWIWWKILAFIGIFTNTTRCQSKVFSLQKLVSFPGFPSPRDRIKRDRSGGQIARSILHDPICKI